MTTEMKRRITEALDETTRVLERARSYMPKHQDTDLIAKYESHRAKLVEMLEGAQ